jgi:hypothetical protein
MKLKRLGIISTAFVMLVGGFFAYNTYANPDVTITAATGGESVSIDTTSNGGTGSWTELTGPVITEGAAGDIATGVHTISLPAGWEFNTGESVIISVGGSSELELSNQIITPGTSTLSYNVTVASSGGTGSLTFSGIEVRPTGTTPATGYITQSAGVIAGVTNDTTSFGELTTIPGTVTQLAITTQPTETVYGSNISSVVVNTKDQFDNNSTVGLGATETVTISKASGAGVLSGTLTGNITSGSLTFSDLQLDDIGAHTLTVSHASYGDDTSSSFSIVAKTITVDITVDDKTYDGTTAATITGRTLNDIEDGDDVTVSGGTAVFGQSTVGTEIDVNATGITLGGDDADLYSFNGNSSTTADITAKELTIGGTFTANDKTYDGDTDAAINDNSLSLVGLVGDDTATLTPTLAFADEDVAEGITVSITDAELTEGDSANYTVSVTGSPTTTADITAKELTIGGTFTANNKTYDGTTVATIDDNSLSLVGIVGDDSVSLTPVLAFADEDVAEGITVSITASSSITGTDAGNYTLSVAESDTDDANITAKNLTVTGATVTSKTYDGTTVATITGATLSGVESSDTVDLEDGTSGTFDDKTVDTGKTVTTAMTISGADSGNYTLTTQPTLTGTITAKELTVTGITANDKTYDGTTAATLDTGSAEFVGIVTIEEVEDDVTIDVSGATGAFDNASIGSGKTVTVSGVSKTGTDADNYYITQPTTTADITAGSLDHFNVGLSTTTPTVGSAINVTITAVDEYDNTISAANGVTPFTGQVFIETDADCEIVHNNQTSFVSGDEGTKTLAGAITFYNEEVDRSVSVYNQGATITGTTGAVIDITDDSDVTSPTISDVSVVVTDETAAITFTSNEDGQGEASYSYDSFTPTQTSAIGLTSATPATITIGGLECGTEYDYTIWVEDQSNNDTTQTGTFTTSACTVGDTTAPTISEVSVTPAQTSAVISFTSNEAGSAKIGYGLSNVHGSTTSYVAMTADDENEITLTGLDCGTTYHYTIYGKDGSEPENEDNTSDATFETSACEEPDSVRVTQIDRVKTYAEADGTYANGWEWIFYITAPTDETEFAMRFKDWTSGSSTIEADDNIRYMSNEATDTSWVDIVEAEVFPAVIILDEDLSSNPGRQFEVTVQARIPEGSAGGSYSTSYDVQTGGVPN